VPGHGVPATGRRAFFVVACGLLGVVALAYLRVLFFGETFAVRDHLTWTLPSRGFLAQSLRQGHLPEWWDGVRLGQRFAADPNNGVTYPLAWLVALVDPLLGADLVLLLHIFLMGMGGLLFARRLGASWLGSFFGAAALMTSGYVASMMVSGTVLMPLGWMPLLAWAALGIGLAHDRRQQAGQGLTFAGLVACSVASGNPAGANNVVLAAAIVVVTSRRWRPLGVLALATVLGILMGAASVLVAMYALGDSTRAAGLSLVQSSAWSMHPLRLFELFWPQFLGEGLRPERNLAELWARGGGILEATWSASDYVGIPVLFCAGLATVRGERPARALGLLSLFFVVLALGSFTPIYGLYRAVFRFERFVRYPEKHLAAAVVLWTGLAAKGVDLLFAAAARNRSLQRISLAVAGLAVVATSVPFVLRGPFTALVAQAGLSRGVGMDAPAAVSSVVEGGVQMAAMALLVPCALWLRGRPRWQRLGQVGFVTVALAQLVAHDWSTQVLMARDEARKLPAILAPLPSPNVGEWPRVLGRVHKQTPVGYPGEVRAVYLHELATENQAVPFGFAQVPGYSISGTQRFESLVAASGASNLERIMDVLDIRYLILEAAQASAMGMPARSPSPFAGHVVLENLDRRSRAFVAYRYRFGVSDDDSLARLFRSERKDLDLGSVDLANAGDGRPRAAAFADPPTPCVLDRPLAEYVSLRCRALHAGYAVLLDEWMDGWSATVDGMPAVIERADTVFRAVAIPVGDHVVEMRYRTPGLRIGAVLSLVGIALYAGLALAWWLRRPSRERPRSPSAVAG
jgi:hypothetical protein